MLEAGMWLYGPDPCPSSRDQSDYTTDMPNSKVIRCQGRCFYLHGPKLKSSFNSSFIASWEKEQKQAASSGPRLCYSLPTGFLITVWINKTSERRQSSSPTNLTGGSCAPFYHFFYPTCSVRNSFLPRPKYCTVKWMHGQAPFPSCFVHPRFQSNWKPNLQPRYGGRWTSVLHPWTFAVFQHRRTSLQRTRSSAVDWPKLTRQSVPVRMNWAGEACVWRKTRRSCWCVLACGTRTHTDTSPCLMVVFVCSKPQPSSSHFCHGWKKGSHLTSVVHNMKRRDSQRLQIILYTQSINWVERLVSLQVSTASSTIQARYFSFFHTHILCVPQRIQSSLITYALIRSNLSTVHNKRML